MARDLDPISRYEVQRVAQLLYFKGDLDEAVVEYKKALEFDPNFGLAYLGLGMGFRRLFLFFVLPAFLAGAPPATCLAAVVQ